MAKTETRSDLSSRPATVPADSAPQGESIRESVEAVIVAIILTLTFRTFLGENYQIPTGSMAPTLQGRHMDVACPQCGYQYRTGASDENARRVRRWWNIRHRGASDENPDRGFARTEVTATTCPICRYRLDLDKKNDFNLRSFSGDRIIVSKLAYAFHEPQRWEVFVFKYPGNPKINYIKRLVGLPGETLLLRHGDVFTQKSGSGSEPNAPSTFQIARKPPDKVTAMLQLVDDTYYIGVDLLQVGWPLRWAPLQAKGDTWVPLQDQQPLVQTIKSTTDVAWLAYRHLVPRDRDWRAIVRGEDPDIRNYQGQLITDYYEYNDSYPNGNSDTFNWVGDLAVEAHADVLSASGEIVLDLVEGGIHHYCRIDIATGKAALTLDQEQRAFRDGSGREARVVTGQTPVQGSGEYVLKFANVDDQLFLWVNQKLVTFDGPTTFDSPRDLSPHWSEQDPGDFQPVRIGARQAELRVKRLRVYRDVYYIAAKAGDTAESDYNISWAVNPAAIMDVISNPRTWSKTDLFSSRREVTYTLAADQFFPMGDNSPQSKDARLWSQHTAAGPIPPPYVERDMLIGKAVFIYWPHGWRVLTDWVGIIPNYQRIGRIR